MTPRAALIAALPREAQSMCQNGYIDPADAFISWASGLTPAQAASRARNARRRMGTSWPDRCAVDDIDLEGVSSESSISFSDPIAILLAKEAAESALAAPDAALRLRQADLTDADTAKLADVFRFTQRRAQQIKSAALAAAADQLELFKDDEEVAL